MAETQARPFLGRIRQVFSFQYNLILFFGALLYSAALASWIPAAVAAIAEIVWLVAGAFAAPGSWIDKHGAETRARSLRSDATLQSLPPAHAVRLQALARISDEVRRANLDMTGVSPAELLATMGQLDETQRSLLRLAGLHQRLSQFLSGMPSANLEREVLRLGETLAREKDLAVRMALRQSLNLVQRRLSNRELTVNMLRAVGLRMVAIEQSFLYIQSHVLQLGSALELKAEVDALVARVSSVDTIEAEASDALAGADFRSRSSYPVPVALDSD